MYIWDFRRKKLLNCFSIFSTIAFAGFLLTFSGCKTEEKAEVAQDQQEYPRSETLYIGGFDWAPPSTFNPLDYDPNFPIDGNVRLMYETLVTYNQLSGELEPMLADWYLRRSCCNFVTLTPLCISLVTICPWLVPALDSLWMNCITCWSLIL